MLYKIEPLPEQGNAQLSVLRRGPPRTSGNESPSPRRDMSLSLHLVLLPRGFASEKSIGLHCNNVSHNILAENKSWIECWRTARR